MKFPYRVVSVINADRVGRQWEYALLPPEYPAYGPAPMQTPSAELRPVFGPDYLLYHGWKQGDYVPPLYCVVVLLDKADVEKYKLGAIHWMGQDDGKENRDRGVEAAAPVDPSAGGNG